MRALDVRLGMRSAAALHGVGAALLAAAAVLDGPWAGMGALAVVALAVAVALVEVDRASRSSAALVLAADLALLGLVAGAVALTDGAHSPYASYYILAVVHVAVFLGRTALLVTTMLAIAAFLAPLAYDAGEAAWFAPLAIPALVPAAVTAWVIHLAITTLWRERRMLSAREAEALRIAESDALTGIGNYRRFWRSLQSEAARARRHDQPFSLIVLDLDGFKAINDELGHQAGDDALRRVARALEGELRAEDVLCRQGGDEFAAIAVAAGEDEASELARRLVDAVARTGNHEPEGRLSASAGWATFGRPERTAEGLLARADRALRDAKRQPRGGVAPEAGSRADPTTPLVSGEPASVGNGEPEAPSGPWGRPPAPGRPVVAREPASRRLAALSACARALAFAEDERSVIQIAVVHLAEALQAGVVELWRHEPTGRPVLVARGHHAAGRPPAVTPVPASRLGAVAASNHVVSLPDGGLAVPVSHEGRVDGVLVVRGGRAEAGGLEERRLAIAMAAEIGRALAATAAMAAAERVGPEALERLASAGRGRGEAAGVAELAVSTARGLGLEGDDLETLRHAAVLHNVGMIGVPAGLPLRPAPLSGEELEVLREHPIIAERLLRPIPRLSGAAWILRHAHERHDGTGYPDGRAGEEVPLASRILHASICYCAMRAPRPWRAPLRDDEARNELLRCAGTQLDPAVVDALLRALDAPDRAPRP